MTPEKSLRIGHHDGEPPEPRSRSVGGAIRGVASKLTTDIAPSVIATVLGAYIVTHYINNDKPPPKPAIASQRAANVPTPAVVEPASAPVVAPLVSAPAAAGEPPVRIIPGTTTIPTARAVDVAAPKQRDDERAKALTQAPKHAAAKTVASPAVPSSIAPDLQAAVSEPSKVDAIAAGGTEEQRQPASAIAEDALEKARKALERAKAQNNAEGIAVAPEGLSKPPPDSVRETATPMVPVPASSDVGRTGPARPAGVTTAVSPLPPPVIVAQPSVRSQSAEAQPLRRVDDDGDRPIPPASIPDQPVARGGFLLIR
jgi:hypothetical protein